MSAPDRAAVLAAWRLVIGALEADPSLPLPMLSPGRVKFYGLYYKAGKVMAGIEAALPSEFTGGINPEDEQEYVLSGEINGLPVVIAALAEDVAERKVTGFVEKVEWVRRPVEDEAPESGERP